VQTILLGVDGSPASVRAAIWAAGFAQNLRAEILAVHVLTYSQELLRDLPPTGLTNWRQRLRERLEGTWTEPIRSREVPCRCQLVEDESVDAGLLKTAEHDQVDLIVLGANGRRDLHRFLGAVTYKVSHRSRFPVTIVPADWTVEMVGAKG
jgi:nucleotide-binding universal stress UspA family protein